jgi:hypothetical protein
MLDLNKVCWAYYVRVATFTKLYHSPMFYNPYL